jgi:branched-chain amino acid transport system permease protein/urea transport system permease protein
VGIGVFALLALAPLFGSAYFSAQLTLYVIYGMLAMSLALVWGRAGLPCFGQAMFFGIGAYAMAISTKGMAGPLLASSYVGLTLAVAAAALFAAVLGYFLFWGRGLSGPYLAIVTLAIALILERGLNNWYALGGYNGLLDVPPLTFASFAVAPDYWDARPQFYLILALAALAWLGLERMLRSPFGIVLGALKTDPQRVAFLGYRVMGLRVLVFVIGAGLAGLAGGLFAAVEGFVSPTLIGFLLSTEVLIWTALGGRDVLLAAFLGAIALRWIESSLVDLLGDYWLLGLGLVLMTSVVLLPKGLIATPLERLGGR